MLHSPDMPTTFVDHDVLDVSGEKVGKVADVVPDARTLEPRWLVVESGGLRKNAHFVPVEGVQSGEGHTIVLPYDKDTVMHAVKAHRDHLLTPDDERELAAHYGLN